MKNTSLKSPLPLLSCSYSDGLSNSGRVESAAGSPISSPRLLYVCSQDPAAQFHSYAQYPRHVPHQYQHILEAELERRRVRPLKPPSQVR
jgi:hypothetical protein